MSNLLIRADASTYIGTGHIMRCLALAQAWHACAQGSSVVFVTGENVPALETRLRAEGMLIERLSTVSGGTTDALATADFARGHRADWIVADGYAFDAEYQHILKQESLRVLSLDDYGHASHYYSDLILNQNISAQKDWYISREPYTRLLLGTEYALLRREFLAWSSWTREVSSTARRILVTMGGADPGGVTGKVLDVIEHLNGQDLHIKLVVGVTNPHRDTLFQRAVTSRDDVELVSPTTNMPNIMAWSDIAISAAGGTLWELCFMQVPTVALSIAENQRLAARCLGEMGVALSCEMESLAHNIQRLISSDRTRSEMAMMGRKTVDGEGASRVVSAMIGNREISCTTYR